MPKDRESMKYKIWRMVASTPFEFFIMLLIVLNTLLLMMKVGSGNYSLFVQIHSSLEKSNQFTTI